MANPWSDLDKDELAVIGKPVLPQTLLRLMGRDWHKIESPFTFRFDQAIAPNACGVGIATDAAAPWADLGFDPIRVVWPPDIGDDPFWGNLDLFVRVVMTVVDADGSPVWLRPFIINQPQMLRLGSDYTNIAASSRVRIESTFRGLPDGSDLEIGFEGLAQSGNVNPEIKGDVLAINPATHTSGWQDQYTTGEAFATRPARMPEGAAESCLILDGEAYS